MDRLTNKKRLACITADGTNIGGESQNSADEKRCKTQSGSRTHSEELPANFVPNSYKEATSRKIGPDEEYSGLPGTNSITPEFPNDCEAALLYVNKWFPKSYFNGRLPSIILSSQLNSILQETSITALDSQLKSLVYKNKIIVFPTFSSSIPCVSKSIQRNLPATLMNYLIVFYEDFVNLQKHQDDPLFQSYIKTVLPYQNTMDLNLTEEYSTKPSINDIIKHVDLLRKISKAKLVKLLDIHEENDLRRLVNAGYLGIHDHGNYCLSLPGAGEFIKVLEKGRKVVLASIRKAKFGEILQQELERRPLSKSAPLGVSYHIADLLGSGIIERFHTTSGPLLRIKRQS